MTIYDFNKEQFSEEHSRNEIFGFLKQAKSNLEKAQEIYDSIEEVALQAAAGISKEDAKELKIEYRAGREIWNFSDCPKWKAVNAQIEPLKERLKDVEIKEKALAKVAYQNSLNKIVDPETGELIEIKAFIEKVSKPSIIFKK